MAINARQKGQRGEREIVQILQAIIDKVYGEGERPKLLRNQMQSFEGGHDIVGLEWIALEIKRVENVNLNKWWEQCKAQAVKAEMKLFAAKRKKDGVPDGAASMHVLSVEPVLLWRQNHQPWRVRMYAHLPLGLNPDGSPRKVRCAVDLSIDAFLLWFEHKLIMEMNK